MWLPSRLQRRARTLAGMDPIEQNARNVLAIHRRMRVDTRRYVAAVESATPDDRGGRLQPLARWAAGFGRELHLHHHIEDDLLFPHVAARVPDVGAVLDGLEADHEVVARILERWAPAARSLADRDVPFAPARDTVMELAVELRDLLAEHLDVEDQLVVPRLRDAFSPDEIVEWERQMKRSLPKTGVSFAISWNVGALDDGDREEAIRTAPLALRLLYRLHAGRFARLEAAAFDGVAAPAMA